MRMLFASVALNVVFLAQITQLQQNSLKYVSAPLPACKSENNRESWLKLTQELQHTYPSSIFKPDVPQTLEQFYTFTHQVFFAEGWEFMPGNVSYDKVARWNLPTGYSDREKVRAGIMRPGGFNIFFMGQVVQKYPQDLWLTQELLYDYAPEVIIELGTFNGAAAAYYATITTAMRIQTDVVSIDILSGLGDSTFFQKLGLKNLKFLKYARGDIDDEALQYVRKKMKGVSRAMFFLDSDHTASHVMKQLEMYTNIVPPGGFIIVEDTNIDGNPVCQRYGKTRAPLTTACGGAFEGPYVAVNKFFRNNTSFAEFREFNKINRISENMHSIYRRVGDT